MARSPRTVLAGVILTDLGAFFLLVAGVSLLVGTRDGRFFGHPTPTVVLENVAFPVESARTLGAVLTVLGVALVVLAVLTRRGRPAGRVGLTVIAVPVIGWQLYLAATGRAVVALPVLVWIVVATVLIWIGAARRPAGHQESDRSASDVGGSQ